MNTVSLKEKFSLFSDRWKPRIIGEVNDCYLKAVKVKGDFVWHHHENEDELFLVVKGTLRMKFPDREAVIKEGEFIIVPRGVEHCPVADEETHIVRKDRRPARAHLNRHLRQRRTTSRHGTSLLHTRRFYQYAI